MHAFPFSSVPSQRQGLGTAPWCSWGWSPGFGKALSSGRGIPTLPSPPLSGLPLSCSASPWDSGWAPKETIAVETQVLSVPGTVKGTEEQRQTVLSRPGVPRPGTRLGLAVSAGLVGNSRLRSLSWETTDALITPI